MTNIGRFKLIASRSMWHDDAGWHQSFWKECPLCGLEQNIELGVPHPCSGCTDISEIWAEDHDGLLVIGVGQFNGRFKINIDRPPGT